MNSRKIDQTRKPNANERLPGQGNSDQGVNRRLGNDTDERGKKEKDNQNNKEGFGYDKRSREGSQGISKGQKE